MCPCEQAGGGGRREFFKKAAAVALGAAAAAVPVGAGLNILFDPLRRNEAGAREAIRVASLDALPIGGVPQRYPVLSDHSDAWNRFVNVPVGAVYLRRTGERSVEAFSVTCPHAGCFVEFMPERGVYFCPCHNSTFAIDGAINDSSSPSPRGLDSLEVELREDGGVWVRFQRFRAGVAAKVPEA